ncbi:MAG: HD domain-containing protein [Patescibacteria group bacterium]|nr:HD domain-containing protein [Patescibacteria group bacterium]
MESIYKKIWQLAIPFYKKGRSYDIIQVRWMMKEGDRIADLEKIDKKLLLPLIILHDVGYSKVKIKDPHIKDKDTKRVHMREGAKIAAKILEQVKYDPELAKIIVRYISIHDNWVFGDDWPYKSSREMALFNDLDFLWVTSSFRAFAANGKSMGLTPKNFYKFWESDEKLTRRPFCCSATQKIFDESMRRIKQQLT